jgi:hypothetical protein
MSTRLQQDHDADSDAKHSHAFADGENREPLRSTLLAWWS